MLGEVEGAGGGPPGPWLPALLVSPGRPNWRDESDDAQGFDTVQGYLQQRTSKAAFDL